MVNQKWLARIKNYKSPRQETVTIQEYNLLQKLAKFKCPLNQNPIWCDGRICPSRKQFPFDDYTSECRDTLKFRIKMMKVLKGKIKVEASR